MRYPARADVDGYVISDHTMIEEQFMIKTIHRSNLHNTLPAAEASHKFEGYEFGDIPLSFFWTDAPAGTGPALHQHRYAEIFVVHEGHVEFVVGDEKIAATGGQIVIAPARVPHRFMNGGTGISRHVDIHPRGRINGTAEDLDEHLTRPLVIQREDLTLSETSAQFEGWRFGNLPVSFFWTDAPPDTGTALHRHPYTEVFVIQEGLVHFSVGLESLDAGAGEIVIVPAGVAHKFANAGRGRSRHLDIHTTSRMATEWLEETGKRMNDDQVNHEARAGIRSGQ